MAYTWHLTVSSYRARSRLPARFSPPPPPLFSTMLLYSSFFCLLARRLDHETRYRTSCVVFVETENDAITRSPTFDERKENNSFKSFFFGRVEKGEERRGKELAIAKDFCRVQASLRTHQRNGQQRKRVLLRPCLGSIDRDRIVSLLPFHSAAFPANPFFCSMHIYV